LMTQAGAFRVETVSELFDLAEVFTDPALPAGRRTAIVTNAGGPGILATDALERAGLSLARFMPDMTPAAVISEAYRGIRPAPGYPACPDHSEKEKIFALLDAETNSRMELTSSYAMLPASSVSGYYFAHPESSYFVLGNILEDQLLDYAKRKDISPQRARSLLAANVS